jgi:hypothetical protein
VLGAFDEHTEPRDVFVDLDLELGLDLVVVVVYHETLEALETPTRLDNHEPPGPETPQVDFRRKLEIENKIRKQLVLPIKYRTI